MIDHEKANKEAINFIKESCDIDGDHHKQWVIMQALKILLGEEQYIKEKRIAESYGFEIDEGVAP